MRLTDTKLFLDGGDPEETARATELLRDAGFGGLDGQTTNPSLVAKNPDIADRMSRGELLEERELIEKYRAIVQSIEQSAAGDISIEVYADKNTTSEQMIEQAREFASWIDSAVIKLPTTQAGLAALEALQGDVKINMTLCFSQQQAAAVYAASRESAYPVYVSPFIGRLDDRGENGMQLIENILRMYETGDGHVEVLTASVRSVDHIMGALQLGTHAITIPFDRAFEPWAKRGFPVPDDSYTYVFEGDDIVYEELDLSAHWSSFEISHHLTDAGLEKFAADWNGLIV